MNPEWARRRVGARGFAALVRKKCDRDAAANAGVVRLGFLVCDLRPGQPGQPGQPPRVLALRDWGVLMTVR